LRGAGEPFKFRVLCAVREVEMLEDASWSLLDWAGARSVAVEMVVRMSVAVDVPVWLGRVPVATASRVSSALAVDVKFSPAVPNPVSVRLAVAVLL
jgi:hypothetical protein